MRDQIEFLKRALNRSPSAGPFGCYHISGGKIHAQNEQMQAVAPIEIGETFSVPGVELEAALSRMATEPVSNFADGVLTLKAGRLRATVPCVEIAPPRLFDYGVDWQPFPDSFLSAIRTAVPFLIGNVSGWSSALRFQDGRLTTINNRCGVDIAIPGLVCTPSLMTKEAAEFLLAQDGITGYGSKPKTALLFQWDDGRALQAQLIDQEMPAQIEQIFASAGRDAPVEITADFRAAYEDAAAITEGIIELRPDSIRVGRGSSKITVEIETPLPDGHISYWETKVLTPMLGAATAWNPAAYPKPALFKGPALYGLVCGIKQ